MPWFMRSLCAFAVFALLLLLVTHARPEWLQCLGLNLGTASDDLRFLQREIERQDELDAYAVRLRQSLKAKEDLIANLVEGRIALPEAAKRFRDLSAGIPGVMDYVNTFEPGGSEDDRLCHYLTNCIRFMARDRPEKLRPVVARLEAELEQHLAQHRALSLPGQKPRAENMAP